MWIKICLCEIIMLCSFKTLYPVHFVWPHFIEVPADKIFTSHWLAMPDFTHSYPTDHMSSSLSISSGFNLVLFQWGVLVQARMFSWQRQRSGACASSPGNSSSASQSSSSWKRPSKFVVSLPFWTFVRQRREEGKAGNCQGTLKQTKATSKYCHCSLQTSQARGII